MKKSAFILLLISSFLNSCDKKEKLEKFDIHGNLIVYNELVYADMWTKNRKLKVTVVDTFCINQKSRAIEDIKRGKLIYFGSKTFEFQKLSRLLNRYGIESVEHERRGVRLGGFEPYCYQDEMDKEIERKFGKSFIDSLSEVAKREYVQENPNIKYIENGEDLRDTYKIK